MLLSPWDSPGKNTGWVAIPSSRGSSRPKDRTQVPYISCIGRWIFFTTCATWEALCYLPAAAAKSLQSCLTLCNPIDGSPPGSPIPGILQARTLEWGAIAFSSATYLPSPKLSGESTEQLKRILHNPCRGLVM